MEPRKRYLTREQREREREKKKEAKRRKNAREAAKRKAARMKATKRKRWKLVTDWQKEKQKELDKAKELEMKARKKEREKEREKKRRAKEREKEKEKKRKQKEREAAREKKKALEKAEKERLKAKKHREALARRKEYEKVKRKRRYKRLRAKKKKSEANRRYYEKHGFLDRLKKRIETNDIPGTFMVVTAQDYVFKRKWCQKNWWNDALDFYNNKIEENHANAMCPIDQISSSTKVTQSTFKELLLVKKINPEVEDNISVFRVDNGKAVTVKTDKEEWVIVLKQPWCEEEKFMVCGYNPLSGKKTAQWIGENFIEDGLAMDNMKKVILWRNYIIFDGDDDFTFAIGKTYRAARNLYMALFRKYEKTDYVYFIGNLDVQLYSKWTEKIKEKTGWKNLAKGRKVYYTKRLKLEDMENPIPTTSNSTLSTG